MSEELQHLMERIKTEAVDVAEARAREIEAGAEHRATERLQQAEEEAGRMRQAAEQDAAAFEARSIRSIEQASRDLLITLKQDIADQINRMLQQAVGETMRGEGLQTLLGKAVEAYIAGGGASDDLNVILGQQDREALTAWFKSHYAKRLKEGVVLDRDDAILKGFRLSSGDGGFLEITQEALTEALGRFLRPHLLEVVQRAAGTNGETTEP